MNGKSLAITGVLTAALLAPAGTALAATNNDHNGGPLGGLLSVFGDNNGNDKGKHNGFFFGRRHSAFLITGTIRAINPDDRTVRVGHGRHGGKTVVVWIDKDAVIRKDGDTIKFGDLRTGNHVRMTGTINDNRPTATRVRVDN